MEETLVPGFLNEPLLLSAVKQLEKVEDFGDPFKQCVAVEFECDGCCKKALNARILVIIDGFLILVSFNGCILVKTISDGKLVEKEVVKAIIIPIDRVCSVEFGAVQVDP